MAAAALRTQAARAVVLQRHCRLVPCTIGGILRSIEDSMYIRWDMDVRGAASSSQGS